jgi:hypothetical protein
MLGGQTSAVGLCCVIVEHTFCAPAGPWGFEYHGSSVHDHSI